MTPFLISFLAIAVFGAGYASAWLTLSNRLRNNTAYQRAIRAAREQGIIEGQSRRTKNLPPSQILPED